jgi:hypothetical protein
VYEHVVCLLFSYIVFPTTSHLVWWDPQISWVLHFLVLWRVFQLWKTTQFESDFVCHAPMGQTRRVKKKPFFLIFWLLSRMVGVTMKNIHDIKILLPLLSLAHAINILYIHPNVVGKSYIQRPNQVGLPCIWENNICDIFSCHVTFSWIQC